MVEFTIDQIKQCLERKRQLMLLTLNPYQQKDQLTWLCTSKGEFSLRSAYHMEKKAIKRKK
jgi:hypothetical protein